MVKDHDPPAASVGPNFKTGAIAGKRVGTYRPGTIRHRQRGLEGVVAVIEDDLEVPNLREVGLGSLSRPIRVIGSIVRVSDPFEIALHASGVVVAIGFMGQRRVDTDLI